MGVMVVLNEVVHAADRVRKEHSHALDAFRSAAPGPLGAVVEGRAQFYRHRVGGIRVDRPRSNPFVPLHETFLGDSGRSLRALLSAGADGVVVAAFGAGHVPASLVAPLQQAATTIPVVIASRTGHGGTLTRTYDFPGSEVDLLSRGVFLAGQLDPRKARLLTWALLAAGAEHPGRFAGHLRDACRAAEI
jgi:L-asparaginase